MRSPTTGLGHAGTKAATVLASIAVQSSEDAHPYPCPVPARTSPGQGQGCAGQESGCEGIGLAGRPPGGPHRGPRGHCWPRENRGAILTPPVPLSPHRVHLPTGEHGPRNRPRRPRPTCIKSDGRNRLATAAGYSQNPPNRRANLTAFASAKPSAPVPI